jgi:protocatechuate 3,4-dioxygenase, beta subunit
MYRRHFVKRKVGSKNIFTEMKTGFKHNFFALLLGFCAFPCSAAVVVPEDFLILLDVPDDFFMTCSGPDTLSTDSTAQNGQSQTELIARCEKALEQNPADDQALEQLHFIIAKAISLSRDESLRLKQVVRKYTRRAVTVLAPPDEPGEPLMVSGTVRDTAGKPIAGVLIYVFHADAKGYYAPARAMDEPNARLFGYMKTGADGRYEFRTIRPGGYPKQPIPQHIHMLVTAVGYRDHRCRSTCQLVFENDPRMTAEWHKWAKEGGNPVLSVTHGQDGVQRCVYDIVLNKN